MDDLPNSPNFPTMWYSYHYILFLYTICYVTQLNKVTHLLYVCSSPFTMVYCVLCTDWICDVLYVDKLCHCVGDFID